MVIDKNLVLSEGQDIVAISSGGNATSTDTITVGKADFGYKGCFLAVIAGEDILTPVTNGTLTVELQASDDSTFSTNTVIKKEVVALDGAKAKGTVLLKTLVRDVAGKKYVRAKYTGATYVKNASQSSLKVDTFITFDFPNQ